MNKLLEVLQKKDGYNQSAQNLLDKITREKREPTAAEQADLNRLTQKMDACRAEELQIASAGGIIPADSRHHVVNNLETTNTAVKGIRIIEPGQDRSYRAMFSDEQRGGNDGFGNFSEFAQSVASGRADLRLRSVNETVGSDGGFAVPVEFAREILDEALSQEIIRPRARIFPMKSNQLNVPRTSTSNHSTGLFGGVVAYWQAEASTLTESAPTYAQLALVARKLSIFTKTSSEWAEDAINPGAHLQSIFSSALAWYFDRNFIRGTGAGMPQGVFNAPNLIVVPKEAGQAGGTFVYENAVKMLSRLQPGSFNNCIWMAHSTVIPQLLTMTIRVGTGGAFIPAVQQADGQFTMLGRPLFISEHLNGLGSQGDVLLADWSQYGIGLRSVLRIESSNGPFFSTDQIAWRAISRVDGQALNEKATTLADNLTTVSPFIVTAVRA